MKISKLVFTGVFCALLFCLFMSGCFEGKKMPLSKDGKALVPIVVSDGASPAEKLAADELKLHLDKIAGADFKILKASDAKDTKSAIYVGDTPKSRELAPKFDPKKVPHDTTLVKTAGGSLLINGHHKRGTLYAVYAFLEDTLGVKWWDKDETFIPENPSIEIGKIDRKYSPPLTFRQMNYISGCNDWKFTARSKNGQLHAPDPELAKQIGQHSVLGYHSFFKVLPPKEYFKDHPEWYSEIKGKRVHENAQLCLSNEEMTKEFVKKTLEALKKRPFARFVHVSQNDWYNYCECKKCKAFEDAHGGQPSASVLNFANKIAEAIEKDYPDARVVTFAYQYSRQAPENIKPRDNVWIELCSIECDFAHPLESDTDFAFTKDIKDWSKLTKNLTIWNYTTCFHNYIIPFPNLYLIGGDIRFFVKYGAIGLFEQGDSFCTVGDLMPLRFWTMAKLMWNPQLDDKKLIDEFLNGYYSPEIAEIYKKYLDTINNRAASVNYAQGCHYVATMEWLDVDTLNKASDLMRQALEKAKELEKADPVKYKGLVRKVWKDKLPIDYVGVANYVKYSRQAKKEGKTLNYPKDPVATAQDIINRFVNFKTERIIPYMKLEDFKKTWPMLLNIAKLQAEYVKKSPDPHNPSDLLGTFKAGTFADFQEDEIDQDGDGWRKIPVEFVEDAEASNGFAAKLMNSKRFSIQLRDRLDNLKSASGDGKSNKFDVYAVLKNKGKELKPAGTVFINENGATMKRYQREDGPLVPHTEKYATIKIGEFDHKGIGTGRKDSTAMQFIWYTHHNENLLIDRFVFVRK